MKKLFLVLLLGLIILSSVCWSQETPKNFEIKLEYFPSVFHSASDGNFTINNGFRWEGDYRFCRDDWRAYLTSTTGSGDSHNMNIKLQDTVLGINRKLGDDFNFNLGFKWFSTQVDYQNLSCSDTFKGLGFGVNFDPPHQPLFAEVNYFPGLTGTSMYLSDLEYNLGLKMRGPIEVAAGYRSQNFNSSPGAVTGWRGVYFNVGAKF